MNTLEKLKIMLGITGTDQDDMLQLFLDDVETDILTWTNRDKLPDALEPIQRQLAVMRYNKQGIEGETAHSEGGISRSFDDLPDSLRSAISQYVKLKVTKYAVN